MIQLVPARLNLFPNGVQPLRDDVRVILSLLSNEKDVRERDGRQTASQGLSEPHARAETQFEWAEKRTRMADERTDWALERTVLASERTLSAWLRTSVAAMAAGLGIARLLSSVDLPWLARVIGAMLVSTGATASVVGLWRYQRTANKLEREGGGTWSQVVGESDGASVAHLDRAGGAPPLYASVIREA